MPDDDLTPDERRLLAECEARIEQAFTEAAEEAGLSRAEFAEAMRRWAE